MFWVGLFRFGTKCVVILATSKTTSLDIAATNTSPFNEGGETNSLSAGEEGVGLGLFSNFLFQEGRSRKKKDMASPLEPNHE